MNKVNKQKARRLYNEGHTIYLLPCKCGLDGVWIKPFPITYGDGFVYDFDKHVNAFEYYNCNDRQTGLYTHFYVK